MSANNNPRLIPIYTTKGEPGAFLAYPYIFNRQGEWVGWVAQDRKVFSVHGQYVGSLTNDPRVVRRLSEGYDVPARRPPPRPPRVTAPASVPLAPMMPDLNHGVIDVLEEMPELLQPPDYGGQDMD